MGHTFKSYTCPALQAARIHTILTAAASALSLEQEPSLYLHHSDQPSIHYLEFPSSTQLPGLNASQQQMSGTSSNAATAVVQREHSHAGTSAIGQPVLVVSSRLVEVLQPDELQMMFLTTLSTALAPGMLCLLPTEKVAAG